MLLYMNDDVGQVSDQISGVVEDVVPETVLGVEVGGAPGEPVEETVIEVLVVNEVPEVSDELAKQPLGDQTEQNASPLPVETGSLPPADPVEVPIVEQPPSEVVTPGIPTTPSETTDPIIPDTPPVQTTELPSVKPIENPVVEEPQEPTSLIETAITSAENFITSHLPHHEEPPRSVTAGIPQKVLDLTNEELKIAYKYYLRKNQAIRSANGVKKRHQIMNQRLTDIETYLKKHGLSSISKIARELNLSPNSVEHYLYLLRKQERVSGSGWGRSRRFRLERRL